MRRVSAFGLLIVLNVLTMYAQRFDDKFSDRTLRIDYIFSGNANAQQISVDELRSAEGWYGRRCNLDKLLLRGNGQIMMTDTTACDTLYRMAFSTLFQEWQGTEEAARTHKSFENVFCCRCQKTWWMSLLSLPIIMGK